MSKYLRWIIMSGVILFPALSLADSSLGGLPAVTMGVTENGTQTYSVTLQILMAMTFLSLLPAALMLMTSFTRTIIVLAILRQAVGMPQTPTNQVLVGLSLFLTFFIMAPVFNQVNQSALQPYMEKKISVMEAVNRAQVPMREFMLKQTRKADLTLFAELSHQDKSVSPEKMPFVVILPAFVTSELKTAFQIGFLLFLPFLILDLVVASVLMSMGMMMLSPLIVSLPFKIMLFVLVDGWSLVMGTIATSFGV